MLDGLKVWPEASPLVERAKAFWQEWKQKTPAIGG